MKKMIILSLITVIGMTGWLWFNTERTDQVIYDYDVFKITVNEYTGPFGCYWRLAPSCILSQDVRTDFLPTTDEHGNRHVPFCAAYIRFKQQQSSKAWHSENNDFLCVFSPEDNTHLDISYREKKVSFLQSRHLKNQTSKHHESVNHYDVTHDKVFGRLLHDQNTNELTLHLYGVVK